MDATKNFGIVIVSTGYDAAALSIVLSAGHGAKLPDPAVDGEYNLVWFDSINYTNPAADPNVEIVRVTGPAGTGDTKTILRAQEDTLASNKNTGGATYTMILGTTAKIIDDIELEIAASDQIASEVPFSPTPGIGSNQVQGAIEELESDVDTKLAGKAATDQKLDDFGTPDDNTDLDSSITRHGLLKKFDNNTSNFLRGDGAWAVPPGGGSGDMLKSVYDTDDNGVVDEAETLTSQGALATLNTVGTSQIDNSAVINGKLADVPGHTLKGNPDIGTNPPQDLNAGSVRSILNVEDGAAADQIASEVPNTPAGGIAATDIQAAINELDTEKAAAGNNSDITQLSGLTTDLSIAQGGTGESTAQEAIDALSSAAGATNEHVLTKDTVSGNAIFKAAAGGFSDPMTTRGDIIIRNAANNTDRLGIGPAGQFIKSDGTDIAWGTAGGGGDMLKSVYDTGDNGIVDVAERLFAPVGGNKSYSDISNEINSDIATHAALENAHHDKDHAARHVTGGGDVIDTAAPAGNAGLMSGADKTKLNNIADNANNYSHPNHSGDVTSVGDGAQTIADDVVSNAKLVNMGGETIKGNQMIGTESPVDLTAAQVRGIIDVDQHADVTGSNPPQAHDLSGALHNNTLLAALNAKITDATLIDTGDSRLSDARTPLAHKDSHMNGGSDELDLTGMEAMGMTIGVIYEKIVDAGVTIDSVILKDGLVDGRDIAVDGTKLDTVDTNADVTGSNPPQAHTLDSHTGTLADEKGGTGQTTYDQGDILFASAADVLSKLPKGNDDHVLTMNGNVPNWEAASSGFSDPMTTRGDIIIKDASNVTSRLGIGTNGQVLGSDGTDISWGAASGIPQGGIIMWSGTLANIPSGWNLCDGNNSTPDLRDKFVRGATAGANPGATGGADTVTLNTTQIPNHRHMEFCSDATGTGNTTRRGGTYHAGVWASDYVGGGLSHENMPVYFALAYIMKA